MKKKILSFVLAGAMCTALLGGVTGCSNKQSEGGKGKEVTLTWYVPGSKQTDIDSVMEEVNKITTEKIGAKIDLQFIDTGSYAEKMQMFMASGKEYDLAFTGYINEYFAAASNGGLMDITEIINEHAPGILEAVPESFINAAKINGKLYGIPNQQVISNPPSIGTYKDLEEKYGFSIYDMKKVEDLEPIFEQIKQNEPNMYAVKGAIEYWISPKWEVVYDGSNVAIRKDGSSYKIELLQETEEYKTAVHKLREYFEKGWIRPDVASVGNDSTEMNNGRYAFYPTSYKPGGEQSLAKTMNGRAVSIQPVCAPFIYHHSPLLTMISVGANCKHPAEAVKFIELINTDIELYNLICFGIEGKHYNLTEEGKVKTIADSGYAPNSDWKFGNQFNAYVLDGVDKAAWEETEKMNNEADASPVLGFFPDTSNITSELSQIANINSEFEVLESGSVDPDEYMEKYLKKLNESGQQKVLEEFQKQIDAYVAAK